MADMRISKGKQSIRYEIEKGNSEMGLDMHDQECELESMIKHGLKGCSTFSHLYIPDRCNSHTQHAPLGKSRLAAVPSTEKTELQAFPDFLARRHPFLLHLWLHLRSQVSEIELA